MKTAETIRERLSDANIKGSVLDLAEEKETTRLLVRVIDVFSYGFIILVSLIAVANVFSTISTNILLRRRLSVDVVRGRKDPERQSDRRAEKRDPVILHPALRRC
ncbi:MAG: hypothetical protein IJM76_05350 [Lachnospiraceae bacterium]|nr:hypothetical protein [Lachnospiraceae bacterium]